MPSASGVDEVNNCASGIDEVNNCASGVDEVIAAIPFSYLQQPTP